jgi:hypothetical protein
VRSIPSAADTVCGQLRGHFSRGGLDDLHSLTAVEVEKELP